MKKVPYAAGVNTMQTHTHTQISR